MVITQITGFIGNPAKAIKKDTERRAFTGVRGTAHAEIFIRNSLAQRRNGYSGNTRSVWTQRPENDDGLVNLAAVQFPLDRIRLGIKRTKLVES